MSGDIEGKKFELRPITPEMPQDSICEFNSVLREVVEETDFVPPDRGTTELVHINEMKGLLDPFAIQLEHIDPPDEELAIVADTWLELIRNYLAQGGALFLRGQVYLPADLDTVDIRSQYAVDLTAPNEIVVLDISWALLIEAIRERRFIIDPNPYVELFALTTDDRTVIGELLFSAEPTPQGFTAAESAL